jgi:hypothetical protein
MQTGCILLEEVVKSVVILQLKRALTVSVQRPHMQQVAYYLQVSKLDAIVGLLTCIIELIYNLLLVLLFLFVIYMQ